MKSRVAFIGIVAIVPGCCGLCGMCSDSTKSSNVRTSGVRAEMRLHSGEGGPTEVSARLRVGGPLSNTFLTVTDGDELTAENGMDKVALVGVRSMIVAPSNEGILPTDSGGRTVTVKFMRPRDTSAPGSTVTMPNGFRVTTPLEGELFGKAHPVVVTWSPTGSDPMDWSFRGACIEDKAGTETVDKGRVEVMLTGARTADGGLATTCNVTIHLSRTRTGVLDPAFGEGGSIVATQDRDRSIRFTP